MPYTKSKSTKGLGTVFQIDTSATETPTWVTVSELQGISQSGRQWSTDDVTNTESSKREFISTISSEGSWKLSGKRVASDAGQIALEAAFASGDITDFQILFRKRAGQTAGDTFGFSALVQDINYNVGAVDKADSFDATVLVSGDLDFAAGATS